MEEGEENFVEVPYTVIVDTREQAPFLFRGMKSYKRDGDGILLVDIKRSALKTGDYSIEGLEKDVAVERKSMEDLFNCVGGDRARFEKQLERLNAMKCSAVMVEADWGMILRGCPHSKLHPKMVLSSVIAWQQDYFPHIHWWFASSKGAAERFTFRILDRYWKKNTP